MTRELTPDERALIVKAQFVGGPVANYWAAYLASEDVDPRHHGLIVGYIITAIEVGE